LPAGVTMNSNGGFSGIATLEGTSSVTITATDGETPAHTATQTLTLTVGPPPSESGTVTITATSGGIVNTVTIAVTVP